MSQNVSQEAACHCSSGKLRFESESLSFLEIPHQSRLFLDYQNQVAELKKYYPNAVELHTGVSERIPELLENYKVDRGVLCDVLAELNSNYGAGKKTLNNIDSLRDADCVAVVTGQQAGLFAGPLYTIYKALSAVKLSECLNSRGFNSVPVFWIAEEDHDFLEISKASIIGKSGELLELRVIPSETDENKPVGYIGLDAQITKLNEEMFSELAQTEFTEDLKKVITDTYRPGNSYGEAIASLLLHLTSRYGLIMLNPLDVGLKHLVAPIYQQAIKKWEEIAASLQARAEELKADNYHAQVMFEDDHFPLFWVSDNKKRLAIRKTANGTYKAKGIDTEYSIGQLAEMADETPERFSPNALLRPVVQDYLLPTAAYFGGAAEIAYFAQSAEIYRILDRPVTTVIHRASITIVDAKHRKTADNFGLKLTDMFVGPENIWPTIIEKYLANDTAAVFAEAEEHINTQINRLEKSLTASEPTLADSLAMRRRKILYHICALRKKFHQAEINKNATVKRKIQSMFTALLPEGHLQERTLNVTTFLNLYGPNFIDWVYESIDLDDRGHRIIYL